MSVLAQQFGQLGESIELAVAAEVERRARSLLGAFIQEVDLQLAPLRQHQLTEKQLADDRHETQCRKLDEVNAKLDSIAALLGTNGSGGPRHA